LVKTVFGKTSKMVFVKRWCSYDLSKTRKKIKFLSNHYCRKMRVPFVVYTDFECFTKPIDSCEPKPQESYTQEYQQHKPSGFGYYTVTAVGDCN